MRLLTLLLLVSLSTVLPGQNFGIRYYKDVLALNDMTFTPAGEILIAGTSLDSSAIILRCDHEGSPLVLKAYNTEWINLGPVSSSIEPFPSLGTHIVQNDTGYTLVGNVISAYNPMPQWDFEIFKLRLDESLDTMGYTRLSAGFRFDHITSAITNAGGDGTLVAGWMHTLNGRRTISEQIWPEASSLGFFDEEFADGHRNGPLSVLVAKHFDDYTANVNGPASIHVFDGSDDLITSTCVQVGNGFGEHRIAISNDSMIAYATEEYLQLFDHQLNLQWSMALTGVTEVNDIESRDLGGFLLAYDGNTLLQMDGSGNVEWVRRYAIGGNAEIKKILVNSGHIYLLGQKVFGEPFLVVADSSGWAGNCTIGPPIVSTAPNTVSFPSGCTVVNGNSFGPTGPPVYNRLSTVYPYDSIICGSLNDAGTATGRLYWDDDQDAVWDSTEYTVPWWPVEVQPSGDMVYTNQDGEYVYRASDGSYSVGVVGTVNPPWVLTTDSISYSFTFTPTDTLFEELDFGVDAIADVSNVDPVFVISNSICGAPAFPASVITTNRGTLVDSGLVVLTIDSIHLPVTSLQADSVIGNQLFFSFGPLAPFASEEHQWFMSTALAFMIGDTAEHTADVWLYDSLGVLQLDTTKHFAQVITCAYDPNDKTVNPEGEGVLNAIEYDTPDLDYLIRFQNTGNDTARTVVIKDQLPAELDRSSFRFNGASHAVSSLSMTSFGLLEVEFANIMLPDSNVNVEASKGWVSFTVDLESGLAHRDEIRNNAGIYFDFNPPIITEDAFVTVRNCGQVITDTTLFFDQTFGLLGVDIGFAYLDYTYQWYYEDSLLTGETYGQIDLNSQPFGDYHLLITELTGCEFRTDTFNYMPVGVSGLAEEGSIGAYPNPFDNSTIVDFGGEAFTGKAWLFDTDGAVVREFDIQNRGRLRIHSRGLRNGMYLLRVVDRNGKSRHVRLVVE